MSMAALDLNCDVTLSHLAGEGGEAADQASRLKIYWYAQGPSGPLAKRHGRPWVQRISGSGGARS